jgi:hypothetical protein
MPQIFFRAGYPPNTSAQHKPAGAKSFICFLDPVSRLFAFSAAGDALNSFICFLEARKNA